jgi:Acetyl-CoA hydrolase/transferase C-terminal domain
VRRVTDNIGQRRNHQVVTEYGEALLHGKTIPDRAKSLIEIAPRIPVGVCTRTANKSGGCNINHA